LDADGAGFVINASRSIIYASDGPDFAEAAAREAQTLHLAISKARQRAMAGA
jgi:orotidine-5'-phosphate decarboxylase